MAQYIDKAALVAEIEKRVGFNKALNAYSRADECNAVLSFLNTIEVKEVDLEKEIELVKGDYEQVEVAWNNDFDFIARHFFELGFKAQKKMNKKKKYIREGGICQFFDQWSENGKINHQKLSRAIFHQENIEDNRSVTKNKK